MEVTSSHQLFGVGNQEFVFGRKPEETLNEDVFDVLDIDDAGAEHGPGTKVVAAAMVVICAGSGIC